MWAGAFSFKTKGILLVSSRYENLDRDRVRIHFDSRNIEGILDGGHNTLVIGLLILKRALDFTGGNCLAAKRHEAYSRLSGRNTGPISTNIRKPSAKTKMGLRPKRQPKETYPFMFQWNSSSRLIRTTGCA